MLSAVTLAGLSVAIVLLLVYLRWRWKSLKAEECEDYAVHTPSIASSPASPHRQIFHHLCPHNNVVQSYQIEEKDSLDEHLDLLTRKLADKEGRLRLSKSKIRETQNEIQNLHAIDHVVRNQYREIMDSLRNDLLSNEKECKKLQEQIEWVSRRRAELKDEVRHGQMLYGEAAAELASNLAELQRGRGRIPEQKVLDKPITYYGTDTASLKCRKESQLPKPTRSSSLIMHSYDMCNTTTNTSNANIFT